MNNITDINQKRAEKIVEIAVKDAIAYSVEQLRWKFIFTNDNRDYIKHD